MSSSAPSAVPNSRRSPSRAELAGRHAVAGRAGALDAQQSSVGELQARPDVRVQGSDYPLQLDRRPGRIEQPVGRADLLGIGGCALVLVGERERLAGVDLRERLHEQLGAERLQARRERAVGVVRLDRLVLGQAHGSAVEAGGESHDRHARALVARHDGALHGSRAAPARQQRGVHVQQLVVGQQRLLDQRPERAHDHGVRMRPRDALRVRPRR